MECTIWPALELVLKLALASFEWKETEATFLGEERRLIAEAFLAFLEGAGGELNTTHLLLEKSFLSATDESLCEETDVFNLRINV